MEPPLRSDPGDVDEWFETLVLGSRVPSNDLPAVLVVKDLLPNLPAITLVAPSLDEIARFVSSMTVLVTERPI